MKKLIKSCALTLVFVLAISLCGCGPKVPEVINDFSIEVTKDGEVNEYLVESFSEEYYDLTELRDMAMEEVSHYNDVKTVNLETRVSLLKASLNEENDTAVLHLWYDNCDTYADYNSTSLFFGTVTDAIMKGIPLKATLTSIKKGDLISEPDIRKNEKKNILITDVKGVFYLPGKPKYICDNAVILEDGGIDLRNVEGTAIILMK